MWIGWKAVGDLAKRIFFVPVKLKNATRSPTCLVTFMTRFFPTQNLHARMDRMRTNTKSLFTDMTWGAGGSTADLSLELALHAHKEGHVCKLQHAKMQIYFTCSSSHDLL